jgi:TonB family protein
MKNLILLTAIMFVKVGIAQTYTFTTFGHNSPVIKTDSISKANKLMDILPNFYRNLQLPYKEAQLLQRLAKMYYGYENFNYGQTPVFTHQSKYAIIEPINYSITTTQNGKLVHFKTINSQLLNVQKEILNSVDIGAEIEVVMQYKYKAFVNGIDHNIKRYATYIVTTTPATEASFKNGYEGLSEYITQSIFKNFNAKTSIEKIRNVIIKFTVNNNGVVDKVSLKNPTQNYSINKLILQALTNMPAWQPAKNKDGNHVNQQFTIPLGYPGC